MDGGFRRICFKLSLQLLLNTFTVRLTFFSCSRLLIKRSPFLNRNPFFKSVHYILNDGLRRISFQQSLYLVLNTFTIILTFFSCSRLLVKRSPFLSRNPFLKRVKYILDGGYRRISFKQSLQLLLDIFTTEVIFLTGTRVMWFLNITSMTRKILKAWNRTWIANHVYLIKMHDF